MFVNILANTLFYLKFCRSFPLLLVFQLKRKSCNVNEDIFLVLKKNAKPLIFSFSLLKQTEYSINPVKNSLLNFLFRNIPLEAMNITNLVISYYIGLFPI
jgi:hypothetical protein